MSDPGSTSKAPGLTCLGQIVIGLFVVACLAGAVALMKPAWLGLGSGTPRAAGASEAAPDREPTTDTVEIGIAYGTEKKRWLEWAVKEFAASDEGRGIKVNLLPMGSLEGAQALLAGDERIHVWSPASSNYRDVFEQDWEVKHGGKPILRGEALALSPMVFVTWEDRYREFVAKYGELNFDTLSRALAEPTGWAGIANKPEWGVFKFGHTNPNQSNSGLTTLVLLGYHYFDKTRALELKDILDPGFQKWLGDVENATSGMSNSTGTMMREMVLKGPSSFDVLFVYENLSIDYLKNAEGRWGKLRIVYPKRNMWNDNPYFVIDAPWSDDAEKRAAEVFLDFLLTEPIQQEALKYGFRPGNPAVPILTPESPFEKYQPYGIAVDLGQMCEPPRAEVINNLLAVWQRSQGGR